MTGVVAASVAAVRAIARDRGLVPALAAVHEAVCPGVLPAGPAGHVLVPADVAAVCDTVSGGAPRDASERRIAVVPTEAGDLLALHAPSATPSGADWAAGVAWVRLGAAERGIAAVVAHLRGRTVGDAATMSLAPVRTRVAEAAAGVAEAQALLGCGGALRRVHDALDETGQLCLHLAGAAGYLADGVGRDLRASELLADTYAPGAPPWIS